MAQLNPKARQAAHDAMMLAFENGGEEDEQMDAAIIAYLAAFSNRDPAPMSEDEGFMVELALECGFEIANDDADEFSCTQAQLYELSLRLRGVSVGGKFNRYDRVTKIKGSSWTGQVCGFYSTKLTPIGYAVESETETGSVQIYPEAALEAKS